MPPKLPKELREQVILELLSPPSFFPLNEEHHELLDDYLDHARWAQRTMKLLPRTLRIDFAGAIALSVLPTLRRKLKNMKPRAKRIFGNDWEEQLVDSQWNGATGWDMYQIETPVEKLEDMDDKLDTLKGAIRVLEEALYQVVDQEKAARRAQRPPPPTDWE